MTPNRPIGSASWTADATDVLEAHGVVQLAGADPARAAVTILNDVNSTADVWVVPTQGAARGGVRLAAGAGLVLEVIAPVYGYVKGAGLASVYAVGESGTAC